MTSDHKLPLGPTCAGGPSGYGPFVARFPPPPEVPLLPQPASAPPSPRRCGVGIDTSRYGHYAAFLKDDLQRAADELAFPESAAGYDQLRQRLQRIAQRHGPVHFVVRLDAAGQYADNLLHFLHQLGRADAGAGPFTLALSCGDPQRNKNYRARPFRTSQVRSRRGPRRRPIRPRRKAHL